MIDLQTLSVMVAATGVTLAAVYYISKLRIDIKTRQAQLFMQLYNRLNEGEFCENYGKVVFRYEWEDFHDWKNKYHPEVDLNAWIPWVSVARFFLGIGTLVKRKMIDVDLVADIMGGPVMWTWEKMSPIVKELKVDLKRPQLWNDFEYLYKEIKKQSHT
jgi:hypothetical protein